MAQTPGSSPVSYCSVTEFLNFKDANAVGQLAMDDGTQATPAELLTNPRVNQILLAASGQVESALLASQRYTAVDLSQPNGASQVFLKQIVANIAMYDLYGGRDAPEPPETVIRQWEDAMDALNALSEGRRILSFQETASAGVTDDVFITPEDIIQQNRLSTYVQRGNGIPLALRPRF